MRNWRRLRAGNVPPCNCCGSRTKAVRRTAATEPLSRGLDADPGRLTNRPHPGQVQTHRDRDTAPPFGS